MKGRKCIELNVLGTKQSARELLSQEVLSLAARGSFESFHPDDFNPSDLHNDLMT